jgi:DNA topoisomerase I
MKRRTITEPVASAAMAGLRYVSDTQPGIRRKFGARGASYVGPDGKVIRRAAEIKRIQALAVPPAWTDVWICADPRGHIQATGRDAKRRKQYRYHRDWRATRDETKFDRMQAFAGALAILRRRTSADLSRPGLPRNKVIATIVQLLEKSLIRIGNEEYAKQNGSFGLTTLRDKHVRVKGGTLRFEFRGKSGVRHSVDVNDRRLAQVVKQCRDLPGHELFQYVDSHGTVQSIGSGDINQYLRDVTGEDFTAKDFRTWSATVLAVTALRELPPASTKGRSEKNVVTAIEAVARLLGNTRAVCRKSYVHPGVIDCYMDGAMRKILERATPSRRVSGLRPDEVAVLQILKSVASRGANRKAA